MRSGEKMSDKPSKVSLVEVDLQINAKSFVLDPDPRVISQPKSLMKGLEMFLSESQPSYVLVTGGVAYWHAC